MLNFKGTRFLIDVILVHIAGMRPTRRTTGIPTKSYKSTAYRPIIRRSTGGDPFSRLGNIAPGREHLAYGTDIHQGQGRLGVSLPRCRQARQHRHRLLKATRDIAAAKRVVGKAMELTAIRTRSRWTRAAPTATIDAINAGRAVPPLVRHSHTSITSSNRISAPSSG